MPPFSYSTGILRYAWPLAIVLFAAFSHSTSATIRRLVPWGAVLLLAAAALMVGVDVATCDDFGPVVDGYWLGTLWLAHLLTGAGFVLLFFTSQVR